MMFGYELAGCLTEDNYEAAIPKCCFYQGYEAHAKGLMLCWGLVRAIEEGERMNCSGCDLNTEESK